MQPRRQQPTRILCPWDSPGKNTGVGCHFLLQCMKVENESEVAQSCLTLRDSLDCSLPGSSIHGIFQARGKSPLELGAIAFSERRPEKTSKTYVFRLSQRLSLKELKTTLVSRVFYLLSLRCFLAKEISLNPFIVTKYFVSYPRKQSHCAIIFHVFIREWECAYFIEEKNTNFIWNYNQMATQF